MTSTFRDCFQALGYSWLGYLAWKTGLGGAMTKVSCDLARKKHIPLACPNKASCSLPSAQPPSQSRLADTPKDSLVLRCDNYGPKIAVETWTTACRAAQNRIEEKIKAMNLIPNWSFTDIALDAISTAVNPLFEQMRRMLKPNANSCSGSIFFNRPLLILDMYRVHKLSEKIIAWIESGDAKKNDVFVKFKQALFHSTKMIEMQMSMDAFRETAVKPNQ